MGGPAHRRQQQQALHLQWLILFDFLFSIATASAHHYGNSCQVFKIDTDDKKLSCAKGTLIGVRAVSPRDAFPDDRTDARLI